VPVVITFGPTFKRKGIVPNVAIDTQTVLIPPFGICTLIPLSSFPQNMQTYENVLVTAGELRLTALPALSHYEVQEISKALALHFFKDTAVLISGSMQAYPEIHARDYDPQPESCVRNLIFMYHKRPRIHIYSTFEAVNGILILPDQEQVLCLFQGE
jgi:hypothetical protein